MPLRPHAASHTPVKHSRPAVAGGVLALYLVGVLAAFVHLSLHWPLVGDATLLHYCVFMLRHGFAPYRQLVDVNLPGTYAFEWIVIRLFGYGAPAWRLFDLALLLAIGASSFALLRTHGESCLRGRSWLCALWVTTVFALLHGRDGFTELGQRDLLMTALVAVAYVGFFRALSARAWHAAAWLFGCGLALGIAATVKPQALVLLPALLLIFPFTRRAERQAKMLSSVAACAGAAIAIVLMLVYLLREHALEAFLHTMTELVPLHGSLFRHTTLALLGRVLSSVMLPLVLLGLPALAYSRPWRSAQGAALLAGLGFGVLSFLIQGRGYPYHRYPSEFFLLLLYARAFLMAMRTVPAPRIWLLSAASALLFSVAAILPNALASMHRLTPAQDSFDTALASALDQRGGQSLTGNVQCIDMAGGCITTLLNLRLQQSTGFLYDCYALAPVGPEFVAEQQRYRQAWLAALDRTQPALLIVSSDECGPADSRYTKLTRWPALAHLLQNDYRLADQWAPQQMENWFGHPHLSYGFRLYQRKSTHNDRSTPRS